LSAINSAYFYELEQTVKNLPEAAHTTTSETWEAGEAAILAGICCKELLGFANRAASM